VIFFFFGKNTLRIKLMQFQNFFNEMLGNIIFTLKFFVKRSLAKGQFRAKKKVHLQIVDGLLI